MSSFPLPDDLATPLALQAIDSACWNLMETAAQGTDHGWRLPVLATRTEEGCHQRTVVLRSVLRDRASLLFHTDLRSPKVQQMLTTPRVSLLFYDHGRAVQLQITGSAIIHTTDDVAEQLWAEGTPASLKMYSGPYAPGRICHSAHCNLPTNLVGRAPEPIEITSGRVNFSAIQVHAETAEWLRLSRDGNLRARFRYEDGRLRQAEWLAP